MNPQRLHRMLFLATALALPGAAFSAQPNMPQPVTLPASASKQPVLTVRSAAGPKRFSIANLEALGTYRVATSTFWPDDDGTYEGPLLRDVLKSAGLDQAASVRVRAHDGFSQVLPREDWQKWPVMLATRRDGKPMSPRHKGPLRIIYPRDMAPELADTVYRLRWVWLVDTIEAVAK